MTLEELRSIALELQGVTEDIKWENHLCFNIGDKMFLITGLDQILTTASFKVNDEDFEVLSGRPGFIPAPYLARYKWIYSENIDLFSSIEWKDYITKSYNLIKSKLPRKKQVELGII